MILDLFAGPGGWDVGLGLLGRRDVLGIEYDVAANQTAQAAGHVRSCADVTQVDPAQYAGTVEGLIASPPCQAWSMAGKRQGELDRAACHELADRMAAGDDSIDWREWEDYRSPLVCQPIRWVRELRPEWIALEEVPAVASLWEHFARIFRAWGYHVWTGDLNAADYGVPQTRVRRILIASRVRKVSPPEPTHTRDVADDLFGETLLPWVSMAAALGWGDTERPIYSITHDPSGGGSGARNSMKAARLDGNRWVATRPATTVQGDPRIAQPGHHDRQMNDAIRITVQEAGVLQSFPVDYPWQGTQHKKHEQIGNAIPPLLAAHILAAVMGVALARAA